MGLRNNNKKIMTKRHQPVSLKLTRNTDYSYFNNMFNILMIHTCILASLPDITDIQET